MNLDFFSRWRWEFALAGAILAIAGLLGASETGHDKASHAFETITAVEEDSREVVKFIGLMLLAETAHRGYMLTQRDRYLEPYATSVKESKVLLSRLLQRFQKAKDGDGLAVLGRIATLAGEKYATLDMTIQRAREGKMDVAMDLFNSDAGLFKMRALRQEVDALLEYNRVRGNALRESAVEVAKYSRISVASVAAVNIILLVVVFGRLGIAWRRKEHETELLKSQQESLDRQVRERTAQLEELSVHLQDVLEAEKIRLARELHDELGAILTAAKMDVVWVRGKLGKSPHAMDKKLERVLKNIDQGILVKRRLIEDLRPSTLSSFGLVVAARELAEDSAARNEWNLALELPDAEPDIGADTATALYRVIQESLNNATKYAQAKHVNVKLSCSDHELRLEVVDDGVGFRLRDIRPKALGLVGMQQRVQARGGTFEISSNPGEGCRIRVIVPLKRNEACLAGPESNFSTPLISST